MPSILSLSLPPFFWHLFISVCLTHSFCPAFQICKFLHACGRKCLFESFQKYMHHNKTSYFWTAILNFWGRESYWLGLGRCISLIQSIGSRGSCIVPTWQQLLEPHPPTPLWVGSLGVALRKEGQGLCQVLQKGITATDPTFWLAGLWSCWSQGQEGPRVSIDTAAGSPQLGRHAGWNIHQSQSPSHSGSLSSGQGGFHFWHSLRWDGTMWQILANALLHYLWKVFQDGPFSLPWALTMFQIVVVTSVVSWCKYYNTMGIYTNKRGMQIDRTSAMTISQSGVSMQIKPSKMVG